jgi:hypothetical protein
MSEIRMTPAAEPTDIPAIAPALRLVEDYEGGDGEGEGEGGEGEEDVVTAVEGEETGGDHGDGAEVSPVATLVGAPPPLLVLTVRATVSVYLVNGPQPYPNWSFLFGTTSWSGH